MPAQNGPSKLIKSASTKGLRSNSISNNGLVRRDSHTRFHLVHMAPIVAQPGRSKPK